MVGGSAFDPRAARPGDSALGEENPTGVRPRRRTMDAFALPLTIYYAAVLGVFCGYGLHRYGQVITFLLVGGPC